MLNNMSRSRAVKLFAIAIFAAYLAQIHSPLRLAGDSPVYLCDAADLADGKGFHDDHLPPGYPHALAALDMVGLRSNAGIVALNLVSMAAGLVAISTVLRRELALSSREVGTICLLCCCSWMWIQLATFPLSEMLFFALSSAVLALVTFARERPFRQAALYIALALLLAVGAFFVRTIGAALFVAVAFAMIETPAVRRFVGRRTAIAALTLGAVCAAWIGVNHAEFFASPWYAGALKYLYREGHPLRTTEEIAWWRIGEVGELAQNISANAFAPTTPTLPLDSMPPSVYLTLQVRTLRQAVGIVFAIVVLAGVWSRRRRFWAVEAYLAAYVGILLLWPFDDPRFFAPVLPLLFAYAWLGLCSLKPAPRPLGRFVAAYSVVFCLIGALAMADSLRVTYFDRLRPWRECHRYMTDFPDWQAAYDRYGGLRALAAGSEENSKRAVR